MVDVLGLRWRIGRRLGRTIYAQVGPEASDQDIFLALVDDEAVAVYIVEQHNMGISD